MLQESIPFYPQQHLLLMEEEDADHAIWNPTGGPASSLQENLITWKAFCFIDFPNHISIKRDLKCLWIMESCSSLPLSLRTDWRNNFTHQFINNLPSLVSHLCNEIEQIWWITFCLLLPFRMNYHYILKSGSRPGAAQVPPIMEVGRGIMERERKRSPGESGIIIESCKGMSWVSQLTVPRWATEKFPINGNSLKMAKNLWLPSHSPCNKWWCGGGAAGYCF